MLNRSTRRLVGGLALALGLIGAAVPAATAVDDLGDLFVTPASGAVADNTYLNMDTHASCPDGTVNVKASLNGAGITDTTSNNLLGITPLSATLPNSQNGFQVTAVTTLKEIFQAYAILHPAGQYTINLRCQNGNGGVVYGDFLGKINVTASATTAFEGTYTWIAPVPDGVATTTTLASSATSPVKAGTPTTLTATVAPAGAGTVQFKDGAANLGAPVTVSSGTATSAPVTLGAGNHSLTAVFSSTDQNAFLNSTSTAKSFAVVGVPAVAGTVQVGRTLSCNVVTGGTPAYSWLVNGALQATRTKTVAVPGTWYNKSVSCRVTVGTAVQTSAAKKVALGSKLVVKVRPKVLGTVKVARTLTCSPGTWSPAAGSYKYQWLRAGKPIAHKVARTYRTVRADKGRTISCKVTALKTGYASGVSTSAARKIL